MKKLIGLLPLVTIAYLLGCENKNLEPNYSVIPNIEFKDFKFIPGNLSNSKPDTLKLIFNVSDGDSDLGLDDSNVSSPYNPIFLLNKSTGELLATSDIPTDRSTLVTYADRKNIDTLPPLNCSRWLQTRTSSGHASDTVYYQENINYYNFLGNMSYQDPAQNWVQFDANTYFVFPDCSYNFFDFRFPSISPGAVISGPFNYKPISSKRGTITLSFASYGLSLLFHNKKIKLSFYIQDRALHKSNFIETPEIQI